MKRLLLFLVLMCLFVSLTGCKEKKKDEYTARIVVERYGTITLVLDRKVAPETVDNFVSLAKSGKYDGTHFIRMQYGFVLQGGENASDKTIKGEFEANGVSNTLSHKKGVISMARSSQYDSATSQFFIMLGNNPSLDGQYAAFGEVVDGWDVIDAIVDAIEDSWFDSSNASSYQMGFLKEDKYITITTIKIAE